MLAQKGMNCGLSTTVFRKKNCKNIKPTHVEDFLALILNAQCVFTASYHGMMFSIYFQRPFYFYNDSHGSRFDSVARATKP